jgi:hypothetical protein
MGLRSNELLEAWGKRCDLETPELVGVFISQLFRRLFQRRLWAPRAWDKPEVLRGCITRISWWSNMECLPLVTKPCLSILSLLVATLFSLILSSRCLQIRNWHSSSSRLARRGGVKRMSAQIYDDLREALKDYLKKVWLLISALKILPLTSPGLGGLHHLHGSPEEENCHCGRRKSHSASCLDTLSHVVLTIL